VDVCRTGLAGGLLRRLYQFCGGGSITKNIEGDG
jgi:hypothetical protein